METTRNHFFNVEKSKTKIDLSPGYKIRDQWAVHYLTFRVVSHVDVFSRTRYCDIVIECMKYCIQNKGLRVHAFVIMTNHMHVIWSSSVGRLSDTIRDFKRESSKQIVKSIEKDIESRRGWLLTIFNIHARKKKNMNKYQLWHHFSKPMEIKSRKFKNQKLDYIHNNPVKAGYVNVPEHWIYSSASNYFIANNKGVFPMEFLDF